MNPEVRCGGSLVVAVFLEACGKEVVCKLESLGKAIYTFANLELDLSMSGFVGEVVFLDKFIGNIG